MEGLELDEKNHWVLWMAQEEQIQEGRIAWHMLENNEVSGLLPFDYYYLDDQICFRYAYHSMQRIQHFFQRKTADFEILYFLMEEILAILERGQEYLLDEGGYLLMPEWIFWNRHEKKVGICYLPGKKGKIQTGFALIIEYLMKHTDHSDQCAVRFIYGLYELLDSDGFELEIMLSYLEEAKKSNDILNGVEQTQKACNNKKEKSDMGYMLKPLLNTEAGKLMEKLFCGKDGGSYTLQKEKSAIGRDEENDLCLPFGSVSRHHALLFCEPDGFYLMDTTSTNGTYLNGKKISAYVKTPCRENDIITFADISYKIAKAKLL